VSGLTVALVSVPLSTALAISSGAQPMMGLTAAVYGPMLGGIFGGSNYNILGPAGALVNILNKFSTENGVKIIPMMAFYSGIMSMCVYLLRLEKYCMLIPVSVLEGFSLSVAVAIGFGQFNFALGLKGLPRHKNFYNNVGETFSNIGSTDPIEFVPFFVLFVALITLLKKFPKQPWIIYIAIVGMIYGFVTATWIESIKPFILKDAYPAMNEPSLYDFGFWDNDIPFTNVMKGAFEVSFVAVLETLISARIADGLTSKYPLFFVLMHFY